MSTRPTTRVSLVAIPEAMPSTLVGLHDVLSMGLAGPTHDERSWTFDLDEGGRDSVLGIERLQEAYFNRIPDYPKGITVPAMVEIESR